VPLLNVPDNWRVMARTATIAQTSSIQSVPE
jgi:hypothetical protein